jgi:hypothetical protein
VVLGEHLSSRTLLSRMNIHAPNRATKRTPTSIPKLMPMFRELLILLEAVPPHVCPRVCSSGDCGVERLLGGCGKSSPFRIFALTSQ